MRIARRGFGPARTPASPARAFYAAQIDKRDMAAAPEKNWTWRLKAEPRIAANCS